MLSNIFRRTDRPNIIWILVDQFRRDALSCHPVFDRLKERGVFFSKSVSYAPYTLASLHAAFTGLYGNENGVNGYVKSQNYEKDSCHTIVEYLHEAGYFTHGYTFSPILFPHVGFDDLVIVPEDKEKGILESHKKELRKCFGGKRPFFSFLHYGEVHHNIVREVIRKYTDFDQAYFGRMEENRKRYYKYAYEAAQYVNDILVTIDELDPKGESLIIVTTDHGSGLGEKPGEKSYGIFTYDYSILVWLYMICPRYLPAGKVYDVQVRTVDILPTILELLQLRPLKKYKAIKGESLLPIIRGQEDKDRIAFSETGGVEGPHPSLEKANVKCVRDGKWKLIYNTFTNKTELYDIAGDPGETNNMAGSNPEKVDELWLRLSEYI